MIDELIGETVALLLLQINMEIDALCLCLVGEEKGPKI